MILFEDHDTRTQMRRDALEALLSCTPVDDKLTKAMLNGILSNHHDQDSRWQTWSLLSGLYEEVIDLHITGGPTVLYEIGDGINAEADLEAKITEAEDLLEEALTNAAGPQKIPGLRKSPAIRKVA